MGFFGRLLVWMVEVYFRLLLAMLRPLLVVLEELFEVVLRVALRLLAYPESWVVLAVAVLWFMTGRGLAATVIAVIAVAGVAVRALLREHTL